MCKRYFVTIGNSNIINDCYKYFVAIIICDFETLVKIAGIYGMGTFQDL